MTRKAETCRQERSLDGALLHLELIIVRPPTTMLAETSCSRMLGPDLQAWRSEPSCNLQHFTGGPYEGTLPHMHLLRPYRLSCCLEGSKALS